jgi:ABC-type glycerol-3-phosphate transport system substrate-binding protein
MPRRSSNRCLLSHALRPGTRLAIVLLAAFAGCTRPEDGAGTKAPEVAVAHLRLLVVGDPAMASAIERLKGEWAAQTGSTLQVVQATRLDLAADSPPEADVILAASHQLAELAVRSWIVPVPADLTRPPSVTAGSLGEGQSKAGWSDVFTLLRAREAVWGDKTVAVPFGSPVLTVYYRADLLEKVHARPPRTWAEYQTLAQSLANPKRLGLPDASPGKPWYGALEPLSPGWASIAFLARAAPYATHRENYSTLFQIDTMEPLIHGPPFVRALEELAAAARLNPPDQFRFDPDAVRSAFWAGQCAMAVTWPTAADRSIPKSAPEYRVGIAELPGASDVYNISTQAWETRRAREEPFVPLLSAAGRLGAVTTRCASPDAAFRALLWLSAEPWSRQVSAASPETTLFRQSATRFAQVWTEGPILPATAAEYAAVTQHTLNRPQYAFALRIPGRAEYLTVLDEAVRRALRGQQKPADALRQVSSTWREITNRLGLDRQREAYRSGLGL